MSAFAAIKITKVGAMDSLLLYAYGTETPCAHFLNPNVNRYGTIRLLSSRLIRAHVPPHSNRGVRGQVRL